MERDVDGAEAQACEPSGSGTSNVGDSARNSGSVVEGAKLGGDRRKDAAPPTSEIEEDPLPEPARGWSESSAEVRSAQDGGMWGSWSSGWGLGHVRRGLSHLASEAAKDVKGLKDSFQKSFAEDDVGYEGIGDGSANGAPVAQPEAGIGADALRDSTLRKLTEDDSTFEQGMKVIDDQVEYLAIGVGKTLGSLWGGLGGAMKRVSHMATSAGKEIVETVEMGIRDVQDMEAVKTATSNIKAAADKTVSVGGMLAATSAKRLETVGRRTFSMFDGAFSEEQTVDAEEPITFDSCLYIYGGQQCFEELEALSSECARKCNKARGKMDDEGKAKLDATVAKLGPMFDLQGNAGEKMQGQPLSMGSNWSYAVVEALKSGSVEEAGTMAAVATDALAEWAGALDGPSPRSTTGSTTPRHTVLDHAAGTSRGTEALVSIQVEGTKRLAEICACGGKGLLSLANSLAVAREGPDKTDLPSSHQETAKMLRSYAQQVACDMEAVSGAFVEALLGVGTAYSERLQDGSVGQKAGSIASDMEMNGTAAARKIQEALRNLLNACVYATLDATEIPT